MQKTLIIDPFIFEVIRVVDKNLSGRIGLDYLSKPDRQRFVGILLALNETGSLISFKNGRELYFSFGLDEDVEGASDETENASEQPNEADDIPDDIKAGLAKHFMGFTMKKPEMLKSIEVSKRYRNLIDESLVERCQRKAMAIFEAVIEGHARLIGSEAEDGLIVEDMTRSTADKTCLVWFLLGDKTSKDPLMVDLDQSISERPPHRIPINARSAPNLGRAFVTLMAPKATALQK